VGSLTSAIIGKFLAFDTSPLIYYIEQHPRYSPITDELFDAIHQGNSRAMTSVLTFLEVLVQPLRCGRLDLAEAYRRILAGSAGITLFPIDAGVCELSAKLRSTHHWIRTPDAIQIATALRNGAELVVTNDERWRQLTEIPVVVLKDFLKTPPPRPDSAA
jgi:predicted nucleic acid-binding protein